MEDFSKPESPKDDYGRRREDWVIEESPFLLGIVALDLRLKNLTLTWETVLGSPLARLLGKPLTRPIRPGRQAPPHFPFPPPHHAAARPIEFSLRCSDGSYRCFEWDRRPARGEEGMFITGRDITERKKMETTANLQKYLQAKKAERSA